MEADDIGRLLIMVGCLATLPLIAWNIYLDRNAQRVSNVRVLMWSGFAIFMFATATRNGIGLGIVASAAEILAICVQMFGLAIILYGFTVTGIASKRGHDA